MEKEYRNTIRPIHIEEDYENTLKIIDSIFDFEPNTEEGDLLEILVILVEDYEFEHYPISLEDHLHKELKEKNKLLISQRKHIRYLEKKLNNVTNALENILSSFKKFEGTNVYMELSEGFTQYNIEKAHEALNESIKIK